MNNKLTIQQFAQRISEQSGEPVEICEAYMRMLFKTIESSLIADGEASFEGLGVFKVVGPADERSVVFTPAAELARLTNAPFAMFEAEELNPDVSDSMLDDISAAVASDEIESETIRPENTADVTSGISQEDVPLTDSEQEEKPEAQPAAEMGAEPAPEPQPTDIPLPEATPLTPTEPTSAVEPEPQTEPEHQAAPEHRPEPKIEPEPQTVSNPLPAAPETPAEAAPAVQPVNAAEQPAESELDRSIGNDEEDEQQGHSRMLMFIVGLIVGLAIGAVATFFYMSEFGTPSIALHPSDIESTLE